MTYEQTKNCQYINCRNPTTHFRRIKGVKEEIVINLCTVHNDKHIEASYDNMTKLSLGDAKNG